MSVVHEFKAFVLNGNVVDLAVGVVIGAGFGKVVDSVVKDVITPLIGMIGGQPDFSAVKIAGIGIGNFINAALAFLIHAAVVIVVKPMNALLALTMKKAGEKPATPPPIPED